MTIKIKETTSSKLYIYKSIKIYKLKILYKRFFYARVQLENNFVKIYLDEIISLIYIQIFFRYNKIYFQIARNIHVFTCFFFIVTTFAQTTISFISNYLQQRQLTRNNVFNRNLFISFILNLLYIFYFI